MQSLRFEIRGVPVPWSRTRIATSGFGRIQLVNAAKLTAYEDQVASAAAIAARAQGWQLVDMDAVSLHLMFYLPLAASLSRRKKEAMVGQSAVPSRGDLSNYVKAVEDGIVKAGCVIRDDSQVAIITADKRWGEPCVQVYITVSVAVPLAEVAT